MKNLETKFKKKKEQLEKLQKEVGELALKRVEVAKAEGRSFNEVFELWMDKSVPKKHHGWLIHTNVQDAGDIWDYIDYGEPSRYRTYDIYEIVEYLEGCTDSSYGDPKLTDDQLEEFKRQLMKQDVGSTVFDW